MLKIFVFFLIICGLYFIIIKRNKSKKNKCKMCKNCRYHTINNCCYAEKNSKMTNDFCIRKRCSVLNDDKACEFYEE